MYLTQGKLRENTGNSYLSWNAATLNSSPDTKEGEH